MLLPIIQVLAPTEAARPILRVGQTLHTTVRGEGEARFLELYGQNYPLNHSKLSVGTAVQVQVTAQPNGDLQLLVQARHPTAEPQLLQTPQTTPLNYAAPAVLSAELQAGVLSWLEQDRPLGDRLEQLHAKLITAGSFDPQLLQLKEQLLTWLKSNNTPQLLELLHLAGLTTGQANADNILQGLRQNSAFALQFERSLKAALLDTELVTKLQTDTSHASLLQNMKEVEGHFEGMRLLNLHSLEFPYFYAELPLTQTSAFRRAELHYLERQPHESEPSTEPVRMLVLDLEPQNLGKLWLSLHSFKNQCTAEFRCELSQSRLLLEQHQDEIHTLLRGAGFSAVSVRSEPLPTSRNTRVTALVQYGQGIDLHL